MRRFTRVSEFPGGPPNPNLPVGCPTSEKIRHVVILMMENHSYDNYFWLLPRGEGRNGPGCNPLPKCGGQLCMVLATDPVQQKGVPTQSWNASHIQFANGALDGFPLSVEKTMPNSTCQDCQRPMTYWSNVTIPFYWSLAMTFPLIDRWFCSCLGQTNPNRRYLISGTSNGLIDDLIFSMFDYPANGTIFDLLSAHGVTWRNYHQTRSPWVVLEHIFGPFVRLPRRAARLTAASVRGYGLNDAIQTLQFTADVYPMSFSRAITHIKPIGQFYRDVRTGKLPAVSIVDPDFDHNSEENPQTIKDGEKFAYDVITALMREPEWASTVLIWLYDEHGGYYDHVSPPKADEPDKVPPKSLADSKIVRRLFGRARWFKELQTADAGPNTFKRLGFRVPAVVVSPFGKKNWVNPEHKDYDHTSILRFIEELWNLPALTKRDLEARAAHRGSIFDALDVGGAPFSQPPPLTPP
jgi:phospholipase C